MKKCENCNERPAVFLFRHYNDPKKYLNWCLECAGKVDVFKLKEVFPTEKKD